MFAVVLDTETTGLEPGTRIVEIAAQKIDADGNVTDTLSMLVNPGMPMPPDAQGVNKIDPDELVHASPTVNALDALRGFINGAEFIVAQNAPYDVNIIGWELSRVGLPQPVVEVVDTVAMAKAIKQTPNNKLATLVATYGIKLMGDAHRALVDADACRQYFLMARKVTPVVPKPWTLDYEYVRPDELPEALRNLPACVEAGRGFSFDYVDKEGKGSSRTIVPYGWAIQRGEVVFHGLCQMRGERRTFKASGVAKAAQV